MKTAIWILLIATVLPLQKSWAQPGIRQVSSLEVTCLNTPRILIGYPRGYKVIESDDDSTSLIEVTIAAREWLKGNNEEEAKFQIKSYRWNREALEIWIEDQEEFLFFIPDRERQVRLQFHHVFRPLDGPDENASFWRILRSKTGTQRDLLENTRQAIKSNRDVGADAGNKHPTLEFRMDDWVQVVLPLDSRLTPAVRDFVSDQENPTSAYFIRQLITAGQTRQIDRAVVAESIIKLAHDDRADKPESLGANEMETEIEYCNSYRLGEEVVETLKTWEIEFDESTLPHESKIVIPKDESELATIKLLRDKYGSQAYYYVGYYDWGPSYRNPEPDGKIPEIARLKSIRFFGGNVKKLGLPDLSALSAVELVVLNHAKKFDLTPLGGLSGLKHLSMHYLDSNVDLAPLANLKNLESLDLSNSYNDDFSALQSLEKLERLIVCTDDLTPIANLKSLKELHVVIGNLTDLSPLERLTNLEILSLANCHELTDLSPLRGLTKLKHLNCWHTKVDSLNPLENLVDLEQLNLGRTDVSDLGPLKNLHKLKILKLPETDRLTNIEPLAGLTSLVELNLERSRVADLSPLGTVKTLRLINAKQTPANDVSVLADLENLEHFNLGERDKVIGGERMRFIDGLNFTFGDQGRRLKLERKYLIDHSVPVLSPQLIAKCREAEIAFPKTDANYTKPETILRRVGAMKIVAVSKADLWTSPKFGKVSDEKVRKQVENENDLIARLARENSDVIGCFAVDPATSFAVDETKRCLDSGQFKFASISFANLPNERLIESKSVKEILSLCAKRNLPVLLQVDVSKVAVSKTAAKSFWNSLSKLSMSNGGSNDEGDQPNLVIVPLKTSTEKLKNFLTSLLEVKNELAKQKQPKKPGIRICVSGDWYESTDANLESWKSIAQTMREIGLDHFTIGSGTTTPQSWMFDHILKTQLQLNFTEARTIRSNKIER